MDSSFRRTQSHEGSKHSLNRLSLDGPRCVFARLAFWALPADCQRMLGRFWRRISSNRAPTTTWPRNPRIVLISAKPSSSPKGRERCHAVHSFRLKRSRLALSMGEVGRSGHEGVNEICVDNEPRGTIESCEGVTNDLAHGSGIRYARRQALMSVVPYLFCFLLPAVPLESPSDTPADGTEEREPVVSVVRGWWV